MRGRQQKAEGAPRRSGWKVRRPRDGKVRGSKRSNGLAYLVAAGVLVSLLVLARWAWPQPSVQRYRYPLRFQQLVRQEARRTHLPASMVAAVILQESQFSPEASSPAGAQGLMQLMPDTGNWVHQHLEARRGLPNLWEPETNVRLGSTYLGYLAERFQGQEVAFLSAYNAGPEPTLEWIEKAPGGRLQVSDIPFPETRAYVEAVLHSERMYRQLYPKLDTEGNPQ